METGEEAAEWRIQNHYLMMANPSSQSSLMARKTFPVRTQFVVLRHSTHRASCPDPGLQETNERRFPDSAGYYSMNPTNQNSTCAPTTAVVMSSTSRPGTG